MGSLTGFMYPTETTILAGIPLLAPSRFQQKTPGAPLGRDLVAHHPKESQA